MANPTPTPAQQAKFSGLRQPGFKAPPVQQQQGYEDGGFPSWGTSPARLVDIDDAPEWVNNTLNSIADWWWGNAAKQIHEQEVLDDQGNVNWFNATRAAYLNVSPAQPTGMTFEAGMNTYDSGVRLMNTGLGGAQSIGWGAASGLLAGDMSKSTNAMMRDGLTWWEAGEIFNPLENNTTLGQQLTNGAVGTARNLLINTPELLSGGRLNTDQIEANFQSFIKEANDKQLANAMADEEDERKLGSSWILFDYDFDIWNAREQETAFEQMGLGQISSGAIDVAAQAYLAPDAIIAIGITKARNARMLMELATEADRVKVVNDLADHFRYVATGGEEGRRTAWGFQAQEFAGMDATQLAHVPMVKASNNPEFVAGILGRADTPEKAGNAILALAGDMDAQKLLMQTDPLTGDALLLRNQAIKEAENAVLIAEEDLAFGLNLSPAQVAGKVDGSKSGLDFLTQYAPGGGGKTKLMDDLVRAEKELQSQQKHLQNVLDGTEQYFGKIFGEVRMGNKYDIRRATNKAKRKAARQAGEFTDVIKVVRNPLRASFSDEAVMFNIRGGRPVMVLKSAANKFGTKRRSGSGVFHLTDNAEFTAENDATLDTTPILRRLAKGKTAEDRQITILRDGKYVTMDVSDYRTMMRKESADIASNRSGNESMAKARQQYLARLEADLWHATLNYYDIGMDEAVELLGSFKYARNNAVRQITEHGWLKDGDTLVVPDNILMSELGESFPLLDIGFIDQVLRAQGLRPGGRRVGKSPASAFSPMGSIGGRVNSALRIFDMVWRPLALMRLGYTQRNIIEGKVRAMAAFGSLADANYAAAFNHTMVGLGNVAYNTGAAATRRARNAASFISGRGTVKKLRNEQARDIAAATLEREALAKLQESRARVDRALALARQDAEEAAVHQRSLGWRPGEATTWDDISGEASGRIGEDLVFGDEVDVLWVDPINAKKFEHGWMNVASQSADEIDNAGVPLERIVARGMKQDQDELLLATNEEFANAFDAPVGQYLKPKDAEALDTALNDGNIDTYAKLWVKDRKAAAKQFSKDGNYLAYANEDGTYTRIRDIGKLLNDVADNKSFNPAAALERVVVLPKGTPVKAVRSTVYGRTLDLRRMLAEGEKTATYRMGLFERESQMLPASPKPEDFVTPDAAAQWVDELNSLHFDLFGEAGESGARAAVNRARFELEPGAANVSDQMFEDLSSLFALMRLDPDIASAVYARLSLKGMPDEVITVLERKGAVINSSQLSDLLRTNRAAIDAERDRMQDEAKQIVEYFNDFDYLGSVPDDMFPDPDEIVTFNAGPEIPGGEIGDMRYDSVANVTNLKGVGRPYTSDEGALSASYIVGEGWIARNQRELFNRNITDYLNGRTAEPRVYAVEPSSEDWFVDLDEIIKLEPPPAVDELDTVSEEVLTNLVWQESLIKDVLERSGLPFDPDEFVEDVYNLAARKLNYRQIDLGDTTAKSDMSLLLSSIEELMYPQAPLDEIRGSYPNLVAQYDADPRYNQSGWSADDLIGKSWAQQQLVESITAMGYKGVRHRGGQSVGGIHGEHQVHIWYAKPRIAEIDELNPAIRKVIDLQRQYYDVMDRFPLVDTIGTYIEDAAPVADRIAFISQNPVKMGEVTSPEGIADWVGTERVVAAAREMGYGKVIVPNKFKAEGYDVVYIHDPSSVNGNLRSAVDNALPGYMNEAALGNMDVTDLRGFKPTEAGEVIKTEEMGLDISLRVKASKASEKGAERFTDAERAKAIQYLEDTGRKYIAVEGTNGPTFLSKSELLSSKGSTQEYMVLRGDEVTAQADQILSNNYAYSELAKEASSLTARVNKTQAKLDRLTSGLEARGERIAKLGKTGTVKRTGMPDSIGAGARSTERLYEYKGQTIADPFDPREAYSGVQYTRASADMTISRDLMGYTNDATMGMRRTTNRVSYSPSSPLYWNALADDVNNMFRNDPIMLRLMRGETPEQIQAALKAEVEKGDYFANAIVRDSFTRDADGNVQFAEGVQARVDQMIAYLPDETMWAKVADGPVTADYLLSKLSWREMPSLEQLDWVDDLNSWNKMTGKIMKTLGTIPENNTVRHPFYRARFLEEMQRQIDVLEDTDLITDSVRAAMRKTSHEYALKQTRETLYTVTRLSTPAYALRFVMPFFPAWESSVKFWAKQMYDKPIIAVRYAQLWDSMQSAGWVVDENGQALDREVGSSLLNLPEHLFAPGGGYLMVPFWDGNDFTKAAIPKGSLNVILPGEYPWLPGVDPIVSVPLSWVANQEPTTVDAIKRFEAWGIPVGDVAATAVLPFGVQSKEKDIWDITAQAVIPATGKRVLTGLRGESSAEFVSTADEMYRTMLTQWELGNRQGPPPDFAEAVERARDYYNLRAVANGVLAVSVQPKSPFQFYINESRRLDEKYRLLPDGSVNPDGWKQSGDEFLRLYGETYYRYTKSLSGSRGSGISPTRSAMEVYEDNQELASRLAKIGENAEMVSMLTNPYGVGEDFSDIIYRAQVNAPIPDASGRYLRGGPNTGSILTGSAAEDATKRDLGWREYGQIQAMIDAKAMEWGLDSYEQSEELVIIRREAIRELRQDNSPWSVSYQQRDSNGVRDQIMAAREIVNEPTFMAEHGNDPHIVVLGEYLQMREMFVDTLDQRKLEGGSADINAQSNADLKEIWDGEVVAYLTDPTQDAQWLYMYDRWFANDKLLPVLEKVGGG